MRNFAMYRVAAKQILNVSFFVDCDKKTNEQIYRIVLTDQIRSADSNILIAHNVYEKSRYTVTTSDRLNEKYKKLIDSLECVKNHKYLIQICEKFMKERKEKNIDSEYRINLGFLLKESIIDVTRVTSDNFRCKY